MILYSVGTNDLERHCDASCLNAKQQSKMMKSIQELAREFSLGYTTKPEQDAAFAAYCEAYRKGKEDRHSRDDWDLSFAEPAFQPILYDWLCYKKERKESYKSQRSMVACYQKLYNLSDGDANVAKRIILQSMGNNWAGIFELKNDENRNSTNKQGNSGSIFQAADFYLQEHQ